MTRKQKIVAAFYAGFALLIGLWVAIIFRSVVRGDWMPMVLVPIGVGAFVFMTWRGRARRS